MRELPPIYYPFDTTGAFVMPTPAQYAAFTDAHKQRFEGVRVAAKAVEELEAQMAATESSLSACVEAERQLIGVIKLFPAPSFLDAWKANRSHQ